MLEKMTFLSTAENRESFFRRISSLYPATDDKYKLIENAYNDAKDAFREVKREDNDRYFEHLRAVALIVIDHLRVRDHHVIIAAILHDIVEDCDEWTIERVHNEYGEEVAKLVDYLTKPPESDFGGDTEARNKMYHDRFNSAPRNFFIIKLADRLHNMITICGCTKEKRKRKITETQLYYLPWAERTIILIHELEEAIVQAKQSLEPQSS